MDTRVAHMITDALYELRKSETNNLNNNNLNSLTESSNSDENKDLMKTDNHASPKSPQNLLNFIHDEEFSSNRDLTAKNFLDSETTSIEPKIEILKNGDSDNKNLSTQSDNNFLMVSNFLFLYICSIYLLFFLDNLFSENLKIFVKVLPCHYLKT